MHKLAGQQHKNCNCLVGARSNLNVRTFWPRCFMTFKTRMQLWPLRRRWDGCGGGRLTSFHWTTLKMQGQYRVFIYIQYRYTNLPYVLAIQRTLEVYGKYVGKRSLCSRRTRWLKCPDSSGSSLGSSNGACQGLRAPQQDLQGPVQISCLSSLSSLQVHRKMFLLETSQEGKRHCHIAVVNMS